MRGARRRLAPVRARGVPDRTTLHSGKGLAQDPSDHGGRPTAASVLGLGTRRAALGVPVSAHANAGSRRIPGRAGTAGHSPRRHRD
eukprot:720229-Prymnesium_polylepis.1